MILGSERDPVELLGMLQRLVRQDRNDVPAYIGRKARRGRVHDG